MRKIWLIVVFILWITILSGEKILTIYQKDKILYSTKTTAIDSAYFYINRYMNWHIILVPAPLLSGNQKW